MMSITFIEIKTHYMKQLLLAFFCIALMASKAQNGFTTYTTNLSITGLLKYQTALLNDNAGNKWIGFRTISSGANQGNAGLVKYDKATGNWTLYNRASTPEFPSNYVTCLAQTADGNIWIGTDSALFKFDGTIFTKYTVGNGLPGRRIKCLAAVGNFVAVGTYTNGLSIFDGMNFNNYSAASATLFNDTIFAIGVENNSALWLGTGNKNFTRLSVNGLLTNTSYINYSIPGNVAGISCIYVDGQNTKWIGTSNQGLFRFDGSQFLNAENLYCLQGKIPYSVTDIAKGLHHGIVVKYKMNYFYPVTYGLLELAPNREYYTYLQSSTTFTNEIFGSIEGDGNEIYYTLGPTPFSNYQSPKMFGSFSDSAYALPIGTVSQSNFKNLDINQVSAGIGSWGSMHGVGYYGKGYQVPKNSGNHTIGNTSFWVGGLNQNNQLCGSAQYYGGKDFEQDYWPGPLDTLNISIDSATSNSYNKVWKVSNTEIEDFILNYNNGNVQNGSYTVSDDILTWPAQGQGNYSRNLAPFIDHNGDGLYNSYDGDYPKIKGDQAIYSIYNDMLAPHSSSFTPMGIEVHLMAYAYGCPTILNGRNELAYTTFYNYKIINRSSNSYHDVFLGLYSVEGSYKNFVGSNVGQNYFYFYGDYYYNALDINVPAQGFVILRGPKAQPNDGIDNDNDGSIDAPQEECKLTSFSEGIHFDNPDNRINSPHLSYEYYNRLKGKWSDGAPIFCGYTTAEVSVETKWLYSGDPAINGVNTDPNNACGYWIDNGTEDLGNGMAGSGPFNFGPGEVKEIEYAFVTSIDSLQTNSSFLSLAKLKTDIQKVKVFYELQNKPTCSMVPTAIKEDYNAKNDFMVYPNPSKVLINIVTNSNNKVAYELMDVMGKTLMNNESAKDHFTINLESLPSGIYFLRLQNDNSLIVKKIIKE